MSQQFTAPLLRAKVPRQLEVSPARVDALAKPSSHNKQSGVVGGIDVSTRDDILRNTWSQMFLSAIHLTKA